LNPISVLACEAQPIVIEGLEKVLAACDDLAFAGSVRNIGEAFEAVGRIRPDVVLVDLSSGLTSALRLIASLKASSAVSQGVLWVVDLPEIETFRALQMGVRGIVRKTLPVVNLLECLRVVGSGQVWMDDSEQVNTFFQRKEASRLTPREKQVVNLICRGMKNKQIAGAAIDVFDVEPLAPDHPFRALDNVLATPHIAYVSEDLYKTFYEDTVSNIRTWLDTR